MKKADQQDKLAAPEKELPGELRSSPPAVPESTHPLSVHRPEPQAHLLPPLVEVFAARGASVNPLDLSDLTADPRVASLERTHELVAMHALRLRELNTDRLHVVIKPGGGLELSLELCRHEGHVTAQASLQGGDFNYLNRHWEDLQQRLEARGIRLAPLSCADAFLNSSSGNSQQQSGRAFKEAAPLPLPFPAFNHTPVSTTPTLVPPVARTGGRGWESWA